MKSSSDSVNPKEIQIEDYNYTLPEERIAKFPLEERDASRLLVYREGAIRETVFRELPDWLPSNAVLFFNNTRVIHARLRFHTPAGDAVEVFCLEPLSPAEYQQNFSAAHPVIWKALIGNNRKWKTGTLQMTVPTPEGAFVFEAERLGRLEDAFEVRFSWEGTLAFGEMLHYAGVIPLPPYLHRESMEIDEDRYQTVYAEEEGSVAAPTAGLHFTERVLNELSSRGVELQYLTLHVGAGTFKPVHAGALANHHMHQEQWHIQRETLEALARALQQGRPVYAVGTTSLRVLESLYWAGACLDPGTDDPAPLDMNISQWAPYEPGAGDISAYQAVARLLEALEARDQHTLEGHTQLLIAPGYTLRIARGIITNFHQPQSTLLLLIAAIIGDRWREVYQYALDHDFRFLSYGDSSLLERDATG